MSELWDFVAGALGGYKAEGVTGAIIAILFFVARNKSRLAAACRESLERFRRWILEGAEIQSDPQAVIERRVDNLVNKALATLVDKYSACRAYVFEFDGYDNRIKPLPWMTCNCTYEVCNQARKVTCEKDNLQHIPLSAIRYWNIELGTKGQIVLHQAADIEEADVESYKILASQQIQSVYCVSLHDLHGIPFGFAGLDYCTGQQSCVKCEADMQRLKLEAVKIGGALLLKRNGSLEKSAEIL